LAGGSSGIPLLLAAGLAALAVLGPAREQPVLARTLVTTAFALGAWNLRLMARARRSGRTLSLQTVFKAQHYLQACAQGAVLVYWGWYWRPVYDYAHLIVAQLLFAYAFDMLLSWTRRGAYTLGFGPFPVIFSINLFLWFRPDYFFFQFLMVAVGFAAKELLRWDKDGRRVHIFNPSSFPLAVFALALLLSGRSGLTWGQEIATTQFYPPYMYLFIFLIGLPGQLAFGVTTMTCSAVVSAYLFGLAYYATTGVYFFYDSYIPIAVFLGMHLLFTDPSTSPRTEFGRVIYGVLYGVSTVALYQLLGTMGLPTFYDKLLQVPILNLSVRAIDRIAVRARAFDPTAIARALAPSQRHLAYVSIWTMVFVAISAAGGVGDDHPGQWLPFWKRACADGRPHACRYVTDVQAAFCIQGSKWACNAAASDAPAGANSALPTLADYPIVLRGSKGPVRERTPAGLTALACRQGWAHACTGR
jgi:hypothetical protein